MDSMKRSWKSQVFFVAALLAVVALLAACSIRLPGVPAGPATKAPTPMPPSAKQVPRQHSPLRLRKWLRPRRRPLRPKRLSHPPRLLLRRSLQPPALQ